MPKFFNRNNFLLLTSFIIFLSSFVYAMPSDQGSPLTHTIETNYSEVGVNNSLLWDGNAWDEDRWVYTTGDDMTGRLHISIAQATGEPAWDSDRDTLILENGATGYSHLQLLSDTGGAIGVSSPTTRNVGVLYYGFTDKSWKFNSEDSPGTYTWRLFEKSIMPGTDNYANLGGNAKGIKDIYLDGDLIGGGTTCSTSQARAGYDHTLNNTQAHSDYLINNGDDTTAGSLTASGNISATYFLGDGSQLTGISAGGNPFNQVLNTTSNVIFQNLRVNQTTQMNSTLTFDTPNPMLTSDGLMRVRGSWGGASVFALMSFKPNVTQGALYGFHINPTINTNSSNYGIYDEPKFNSNNLKQFVGHKLIYPAHISNRADTLGFLEETSTRTYINTLGKVDINGIKLGQAIGIINFGGGGEPDYEENMITLTGGISSELGVILSPIQRGLKFMGFGNKGTNATIEAIYMDGGDINIDSDASFIKMGADQDALIRFDGTNLNVNMTTNGALTILNSTGLGKVRALEYATSTPKDSDYSIDDKYIDDLPSPENLLDEDGKIVIGALRQSQTTYWETDFNKCNKVGTGNYWYCYDVVIDGQVQEQEFCQYTQVEKDNKYLTKERYVEIMEDVCGRKEVNVTLVETQAFENTIMISELKAELNRINSCLEISRDFVEYKICVGGTIDG